MRVRVVIPRSVPAGHATRIMWIAWTHGYSSRLIPRPDARGWVLVEFLIVVDNLASGNLEAGNLEAFEIELDEILSSRPIRTEFRGSGAWTEAA